MPKSRSLVAALAMIAGMWSIDPALASAQWWRGRMQQIMIQSAQASQKMAEEMQKQQEADEKAFMERFDTNHDGKITGKEKGPATKYLRAKEMGLDPDATLNKQKQSTMKLGKTKKSAKSAKSPKPKEPKEPKVSNDAKE